MSRIKKLMGQTAIYGLPTIIGRVVNFLLTPLLTGVLDTSSYGIMSELFVYIGIFLALLTWGMETSVFRFSEKYPDNPRVFSTAFSFTAFLAVTFVSLSILFAAPGAVLLKYPGHGEYIVYIALIIGFDVLAAVPMAKLRQMNKPIRFATANLFSILLNIALVLFFLVYCRGKYMSEGADAGWLVNTVYDHNLGMGYVFIANIVASFFKFVWMVPLLIKSELRYDPVLLREMLIYSTPLGIASVCFIINERADLAMLKFLLPADVANSQVGIYSAVYKLAIIMNIFIQAFRFAAEPFFFSSEKEKGSRAMYARVLNYFTGFCLIIFLGVTLFMGQLKYFLRNEDYWVGLSVVPILLLANLFSGIYQNLSMWYKLSGRTLFGMWFSILGALLTLVFNFALIPFLGYVGSAWATLACYFSMTLISYIVGQKHYPIPYEPIKVLFYIGAATAIYLFNLFIPKYSMATEIIFGFLSVALFTVLFVYNEKELRTVLISSYDRFRSKNN
ncbi:MAG: polysaccharide biosynthesis C-terminal domain-containing protein [Flavobacteriales bacterium]|nr:polysaccharide biosynthesis C-terminal domain-containing protein [Flavobacteriales bacterium]